MSQMRVRDLNEDLEKIGLSGGIDLSLAGLTESAVENDADTNTDSDDEQTESEEIDISPYVESVTDELYEMLRATIEEDEIDYDVEQFESDLRDVIEQHVIAGFEEMEIDEDTDLEEASRVIMKRKGGRLVRTRQKLASVGERRKRRMKARKNRARIKLQRKKAARKNVGKKKRVAALRKRAEKKARASGQIESATASRILGLLAEANEVDGEDFTAVEAELAEAYDRTWEIFESLVEFFSVHADEEDYEIAEALAEVSKRLDLDESSLYEGEEEDLATRIANLQVYGKAMAEAIEVFNQYSLVEGSYEDDDDDDACDDCGEMSCEGNCGGN